MNKIWEHFYKRVVCCKRGGGGDSEPTPPPAPSPMETSEQAIQAQIDALPKILEAQKQYGSQFSDQQLSQLNEFGPQYAQASLDLSQQFGGDFAQQVKDEQDILDPSRSAGSDAITKFLEAGPQGLTANEEDDIMRTSRNATASRGLGESGFGALDETVNLFNARQNINSRYLNVGLSAAGRLPAAGGATVGANPASYGNQMVQNVSPSQIFGAQSANNAYNSSIFNTQSQSAAGGGNMGSIGSMAGMAIGGLLAAPTGGMSLAAGAALGGSFGGAAGSMFS